MDRTLRLPGQTDRREIVLRLPLYPIILPVGFVIDMWLKTSLDASLLLRPIVVAVLAAVALTGAAILFTRDRDKGAVLASLAAVAIVGGDDLRVVALALVAICLVVALARRRPTVTKLPPWSRATSLLDLVSVVMLGILTATAASSFVSPMLPDSQPDLSTRHPAPTSDRPPDIVVILLDAHGREDLLAERYGEDVSEFVASLSARGFDVSPRSRSNYMSTSLTLTSMFNYAHLSDLTLPMSTDPSFGSALRSHLDRNKAFATLRAAGYRIATVSAGFDGDALRSADVFIDGGQVNELEAVLITNSILRRTLTTLAPNALPDQVRDRVRWNLSPSNWLPRLVTPGASHDPSFLFVHVPSPHPPYVFARDGTNRNPDVSFADNIPDVNQGQAQISALAEAYANQLAYVDELTISAVDEVLLSMPSDCVLIVMSDHGPAVHIDWEHLSTTDTDERFGTLFAARTPGSPNLFGDAPTPVNLFPTLFNRYLDLRLPMASNSSFIGVPPRQDLIEIGDPDAQ